MTLPLFLALLIAFFIIGLMIHRPVALRNKIQKGALNGDAESQYRLGVFCYTGDHFPQDDKQAYHWFSQAAGQGHVKAYNALAGLYNEGRGCEKDPQKAFAYYQKAANTGDFEGRINLAVCHLQGIGTPKNETQGFALLKQAADEKSPLAQTLLAGLYERGTGTAKDPKQALHYYVQAAKAGEPMARKWLDQLDPQYIKQYKNQN